ncbi:hypothetical protein LTR85_003689 [Meristemomyces frigidus]|nr:hypothetical protein LTR85_003689 [Meristemomyces frigidus]
MFANQSAAFSCETAQCAAIGARVRDLQCTLSDPPDILTIRLQRFATIEKKKDEWVSEVIRNDVSFEEFLDIGEYTGTGDNVIYRLEGVVAHDCRTKRLEAGGHFIAVVRKHDGRTFSTLNDNQGVVSGATINELYSPRSNKTEFKPYMLVYSKL